MNMLWYGSYSHRFNLKIIIIIFLLFKGNPGGICITAVCKNWLTHSADDYPGTVNVLLSIALYNRSHSVEVDSGLELGS